MSNAIRKTVHEDKQLIEEIEDTKVPYGMLAVWSLGQASFIVKGGATVVYVDPFALADDEVERRYGLKRLFPSPMRPEQITNADYCLITHEHDDHLDPDTIRAMAAANSRTRFAAPNCCLEEMRQCGVSEARLYRAETDKIIFEDDGFFVKPIPAAHEQLDKDGEGFFKYAGYVVRLNGVTWYHAGDTVIYDGLTERVAAERIDLALLPINGRDAFRTGRGIIGNMDYREAAELAHRAGFGLTIPMHYDLFAGNTERPGYFVDYVYDNFPRLRTHVMARGERFVFVSDAAL
ncbi:MBL fold metallo-hydrolase [Cohnella cellulosilytica]|uniref:MBL fold metallo-hydrolase n=1 Tax=Cohnella cellulosilytica TaxID=986710 RepID=A0ABW2F9T9_9BACL